MSGDESLMIVRLEDGEIDEIIESPIISECNNAPSLLCAAGEGADMQETHDLQADAPQTANAIFVGQTQQKKRKSPETYDSCEKTYLQDEEVVFIDENEMLCVRGGSPVTCVVERLSYNRKSPLQDCGEVSFDITPPKKRKSSTKRRRKHTTPRKIVKNINEFSDDDCEGNKSKSKERSESPSEIQEKLPQLCKFYLQDCCAKKSRCEYMHSEFPCKFYYMGLECKDENSEAGCKLSHGSSLCKETLNNLVRHINTAPVEVLGQEFVAIRSKLSVIQINQMLQKTQESLQPCQVTASDEISSRSEESTIFLNTLREKFLDDEQINGLREFGVTKVENLLNLTLAQLNSIAIRAVQIEAIQMYFAGGQDTDMRYMFPSYTEVPFERTTIPSFEVVCFDERSSWFEKDEEGPLVIDEAVEKQENNNESKLSEDDDIIIDVVGDANSDSELATTNEDELVKVLDGGSTTYSPHCVIEEIQKEITLLPNLSESLEIPYEHMKQQEDKELKKSEEYLEDVEDVVNSGNQNEIIHDDIEVSFQNEPINISLDDRAVEEQNKYQNCESFELSNVEDSIEKHSIRNTHILSQNAVSDKKIQIKDKFVTKCELDDSLQHECRYPTNDRTEKQTVNENQPPIEDVIVKANHKTVTEGEKYDKANKNEISQSDFSKEEVKKCISIVQKESTFKSQCSSPLSPKETKQATTLQIVNVVEEIDLTLSTSPKISSKIHSPIRFIDEAQGEYKNSFNQSINVAGNEVRRNRFSKVKQRQTCYSQSYYRKENQMQNDNSSEDWDADERSDIQSPPKEIASPDQSDCDFTTLVTDGAFLDFPRRSKNLDNYKPAVEINAHLTYPPMEYKVFEIIMPEYEVNKPTFIDKLIKANSTDPRLKKFIEKEKNCGVFPKTEYSFFPPDSSKYDPRVRSTTSNSGPDYYYNISRTLYNYLQRSQWYQDLKSNLKIQINHSVSDLVRALNYFHKDNSPQKIFDLFQIDCAGILLEVMRNVGIFIDANGNITEEANYSQLCIPLQQSQQSSQFFAGSSQPKPGLLGFAPPGLSHSHQNNTINSNQNSFARQAFGNDCFCVNNKDFETNGSTFYVGGRFPLEFSHTSTNCNQKPINRNNESDFDNTRNYQPMSYQRQFRKRHFKRR